MKLNCLALGFVLLASSFFITRANAQTPDPKLGTLRYEGSGEAEKGPEFGTVWFSFEVSCRESADDVMKTIKLVSGKTWNSIATKVPPSVSSATQQALWGDISSPTESPGSVVSSTPPANQDGVRVPGTAKRTHVCTGAELPLNAKVATVFSGSQRFGVRAADLDWVEGLRKTVLSQPQIKAKDAVTISASSIAYDVSDQAKRELFADTLRNARLEATGPDSKYASDQRMLRFQNSHFIGEQPSQAPAYHHLIGNSVTRGEAPKVTLQVPLVYTIYSEGKDLISSVNNRTEGVRLRFEVVGKATAFADFGDLSVSVKASCQASEKEALTATEPYSTDLLKDLDFQGIGRSSETDGIENNEAETPRSQNSYQAVEWDYSKPKFPATRYLNKCTNELVDAPISGDVNDLPRYFSTQRTFTVRAKHFASLLHLAETLQRRYSTSTLRADDTRVIVGNVAGQVTGATKRRLSVAARENATAYILSTQGLLAQSAQANALTSAYLVDLSPGSPIQELPGASAMKARAMFNESAPGGMPEDSLAVIVTHKSNDQRPKFKMVRHFLFTYQIMTENYLPLLKVQNAEVTKEF